MLIRFIQLRDPGQSDVLYAPMTAVCLLLQGGCDVMCSRDGKLTDADDCRGDEAREQRPHLPAAGLVVPPLRGMQCASALYSTKS